MRVATRSAAPTPVAATTRPGPTIFHRGVVDCSVEPVVVSAMSSTLILVWTSGLRRPRQPLVSGPGLSYSVVGSVLAPHTITATRSPSLGTYRPDSIAAYAVAAPNSDAMR